MIEVPALPQLTWESRVILSTVVAVVALLVLAMIPRAVRYARTRIDARISLEIDHENQPVRVGTVLIVRLLQLIVVAGLASVLAGIWGEQDTLVALYEILATTFPTLSRVILTGILLLGTYYVMNVVESWVARSTHRARRFNRHDQEIITRIGQLLVLLTSGLFILLVWNIDVSGLLVGAGVLGIILGYAARDTLGSVVAGLVLMFSRPFEIGDWILVGDERGIVTDITIVNTRLRSPTGEHVILPNSEITKRTIRNRSHEPRLRFHVDVGIDFDEDVEHAQQIALDAVDELDIVADTPFPSALVDRLEDSAIILRVRFWVNRASTEKMWKAEHQVLSAITDAFNREGINIPYPHQRFIVDEDAVSLSGDE